ncbi:MAG: amphi-Trp domain-containing protein [Caldimicrobium thiodismutans]|jgi:amphi-Trp domain-containing protein
MAEKEKVERLTNKEGLIAYFKDLISQVEQGYVMVGERRIELPESFELEIKYKEKDSKKEIEWEIEWKI